MLPVLLGGFILYWVYRDFDFERAKELLLHGTDWGGCCFIVLAYEHVFRGWRWRQTLEPLGLILKGAIAWTPFHFLCYQFDIASCG